ncbi:hypothetical protein Metli_0180 [Methanofollis liminatans DSM 4140]|uniref:Endonuclease NucS C-terminal domain-containing protein n=1 Tax=Methanofollis liminatans DSM 4140 TaxID=28892 RepID=J0RX96_9EURY|nr:endonuclease NucS domain-containing protein [Methanofollis liminatans]EJG06156.1 hypothetical protein Metli_0180 [Methanofollis liminatans DSM 4140]
MPAVLIKDNTKSLGPPEFFQRLEFKEKRLQELIADHPELLTYRNEPQVKTIYRELRIDTGDVDIFMADSEGLPIIVEVKMHDNYQCQREVVGQIHDYASSLPFLTFDQLNAKTGRNLEEVLRSFCKDHQNSEDQEMMYNRLKSRFEGKIRDGDFRLIIAVDSAPNELLRTWLYENAHSKLDIRLVAINAYRLNDGSEILVPYHLVSYKSHTVSSRGNIRSNFQDIINAFREKMVEGIVIGREMATNCVILNTHWPGKEVHYEFTDWLDENRIGVEIQANLALVPDMQEAIISLKPLVQENFPNYPVNVLNGGKYNGWARLQVSYNGDIHPSKIAEGMRGLIEMTMPIVTDELIKKGMCK